MSDCPTCEKARSSCDTRPFCPPGGSVHQRFFTCSCGQLWYQFNEFYHLWQRNSQEEQDGFRKDYNDFLLYGADDYWPSHLQSDVRRVHICSPLRQVNTFKQNSTDPSWSSRISWESGDVNDQKTISQITFLNFTKLRDKENVRWFFVYADWILYILKTSNHCITIFST